MYCHNRWKMHLVKKQKMTYLLDTFSWTRTLYQQGSTSRIILPRKYAVCAVNSIISLSCISSLLCKKSENPAVVGTQVRWLKRITKHRQWQAISQRMFMYGAVQGHWAHSFIHVLKGLWCQSFQNSTVWPDFTKHKQPLSSWDSRSCSQLRGSKYPVWLKQSQDLDIRLLF